MVNPYRIKEALVVEHFRHKATADEFANAFAYMNCIDVRDFSDSEEFRDELEPKYIILSSDNDSMNRGDIVSWSAIEVYMDNLLVNGCEDDIECLYTYLTDKY